MSKAPQVPAGGKAITLAHGKLVVPDHPVIPFIEGDGTGPDIWKAAVHVFDAAVEKAYGGKRKIHWMEVLAGQKAFLAVNNWLPDETLDACRKFLVSIKGPLETPVGGGIRSLNVALRQNLDLYVCLRPVRWYHGVPSPVREPEKIDMVDVFRNSENVPPILDEALALPHPPDVFWLQQGIRNDEVAAKAEAAGMKVVMNRCPKIEYGRLSGEISWVGVNPRTI